MREDYYKIVRMHRTLRVRSVEQRSRRPVVRLDKVPTVRRQLYLVRLSGRIGVDKVGNDFCGFLEYFFQSLVRIQSSSFC